MNILDPKLDVFLNKIFNTIIAYEENACRDISDGDLSLKEIRYIESANILGKNGNNTSAKIANYLFITPSTLSIMTKKLEEKGYLKKIKSTSDQRVNYIIPTDRGVKIITYHQAYHSKLFNMIFENSTEEEQKGLIHILKMIEHYFNGEVSMRPHEVENLSNEKE